jgi:hypothetical protein
MKIEHFDQLVRRLTGFFLSEILPRYLERDYFGKGYYFLKRLLTDLDHRKLLAILEEPDPSPRAKARARSILSHCPIRVSLELKPGEEGGLILGEFSQHEQYTSFGGTYINEHPSEKHITIFRGSFEALRFASEADLEYKLLETISHEFVHFFESHFLRSEQELARREQPVEGLPYHRLSLEEARRKDHMHQRLTTLWWVVAVIVGLIVVWLVISGL